MPSNSKAWFVINYFTQGSISWAKVKSWRWIERSPMVGDLAITKWESGIGFEPYEVRTARLLERGWLREEWMITWTKLEDDLDIPERKRA